MMRYPSFIALIVLLCGLLLGNYLLLPSLALFIALIFWWCWLLWSYRRQLSLTISSFVLPFLLIGLLQGQRISYENRLSHLLVKQFISVPLVSAEGKVSSSPQVRDDRLIFTLSHATLTAKQRSVELPTKLLVTLSGRAYEEFSSHPPLPGETVSMRGLLFLPRHPSTPYLFDYRRFLEARGIAATLRCVTPTGVEITKPSSFPPLTASVHLLFQLRTWITERLKSSLHEGAPLTLSVLLGSSHELSDVNRHHFLRTGLLHLFAVSGLHTGIIAVFLLLLFSSLRMNYRVSSLLIVLGLIFYCALVGFRTPVVRATIMISCLLLGRLSGRHADSFSALSFAAFLLLIANPRALYQVDFQLSFLAVGSIIILSPILFSLFNLTIASGEPLPQRKLKRFLNIYLLRPMLVVVSLYLGLLPLQAHYFHTIAPGAILSNLLIVPLTFLLICLTLLFLLLSPLTLLASLMAPGIDLLSVIILGAVKFLSSVPFFSFHIAGFPWWLIAVYYLLLFSGPHLRRDLSPAAPHRKKAQFLLRIALIVLILVWLPIFAGPGQHLYVFCLDAGQGDAIFVEFPNGKTMLIDAGPTFPHDMGKYVVEPFLRGRGIDTLDAIIATHYDADHIGGLPWLVRHFEVDYVFTNGTRAETNIFQQLQKTLAEEDIPTRTLRRGDRLLGFSPAELSILHPTSEFLDQPNRNNTSIVLRLKFNKVAFLFTGDAEREVEADLLESELPLSSQVLKVGHHGSRSSSSPEFLRAVSPIFALISVGRNNKYGHPHPEVLQRLERNHAQVYRTDQHGTLLLITNGMSLRLLPFSPN